MNALIDNVSVLWDRLLALFSSYNIITDTLDIAFVAFLVFSAIKMLKETRGIQIVKGLVLVAIIYAIISLLNMQASTYFTRFYSGAYYSVYTGDSSCARIHGTQQVRFS